MKQRPRIYYTEDQKAYYSNRHRNSVGRLHRFEPFGIALGFSCLD